MIKVTNQNAMERIKNTSLKAYIQNKADAMMQEYQVENLDEIGCFVVLEQGNFTDFPINEMEFVEVLNFHEDWFLHGVKIIDDSYGEDIYLPIEVVKC